MKNRPLSVTILAWLFIAVGVGALFAHFGEFKGHSLLSNDILEMAVVELLAIAAGIFMLRGSNWARWLAILWMAFHVGVSAFHSMREVIVHTLLLLIFAYFLFRKDANQYFRPQKPEIAQP